MSDVKTFSLPTSTLKVDDTKILFDKGNKINKEKKIIFLDKIEYLGLTSFRDLRILLGAVGAIVIQGVLYFFDVGLEGMLNWGIGVIGLLLLLVFYYLKESCLEIKAANSTISIEYNEEILEYIIKKIEDSKNNSFEF